MPRADKKKRQIMTLFDALGRRWSLRILWELRGETLTFRALRAAAGDMSPSVLNTRLAELRDLGIVEATADGYALTGPGRELGKILLSLNNWAAKHI